MTTRNEVVLIVWGTGVSMKHLNHMILLFSSPKKERNFRYHQEIKAYACRGARLILPYALFSLHNRGSYVCLSVCLLVYLFVCLFVCLSAYLFVCLFFRTNENLVLSPLCTLDFAICR